MAPLTCGATDEAGKDSWEQNQSDGRWEHQHKSLQKSAASARYAILSWAARRRAHASSPKRKHAAASACNPPGGRSRSFPGGRARSRRRRTCNPGAGPPGAAQVGGTRQSADPALIRCRHASRPAALRNTHTCSRNSSRSTLLWMSRLKGDRSGLRPLPIVASLHTITALSAAAPAATRRSTHGRPTHWCKVGKLSQHLAVWSGPHVVRHLKKG